MVSEWLIKVLDILYIRCKTDQWFSVCNLQGSLYSPFLHDAVYAYAFALNKTLENGDELRDGRVIMENSKNMHFQGAVLNFNLNRQPKPKRTPRDKV